VQRWPDRSEAVERWALSRAPSAFDAGENEVRLLLKIRDHIPSGALDVRVQLHRLPTYPLVVVTVAAGQNEDPAAVFFDVAPPEDRQALTVLAHGFRLVLEFFDEEHQPVARREVELPLAANVRYALTVADEELGQLPEARRSFDAAVAAFRAA